MSADDTVTVPRDLAERLLRDLHRFHDGDQCDDLDEFAAAVNPHRATDEMVDALVERHMALRYPPQVRTDSMDRADLRAALTAAIEAGWTPPKSDGEGADDRKEADTAGGDALTATGGATNPSPSPLRPLTEDDYEALHDADPETVFTWESRDEWDKESRRRSYDAIVRTAAQRGVYPSPERREPTDEDVEGLAEVIYDWVYDGVPGPVVWSEMADTPTARHFCDAARAAFEWMEAR